ESSIGTVGLELEFHVVDLAVPARRVAWDRLVGLVAELAPMPCGSAVTLEPGGQVELSTLPTTEITSAVAALDADRRALSAAFTTEQLALVALGADPARPPERMSPKGRYAAMEQHFLATGSANPGAAMMCSTAALQVNINAGPAERWSTRVSRLHQLGPILVAISACSPYLAGRTTGWKSMRQQAWGEIDQARCGPLLGGPHPEDEWASYALLAPVMLVNDPVTSEVSPITTRVSFEDWVSGAADLGRPATAADLDYHLSTLFPPVRLRGFLEVRCIDAVPQKWWPGLAGIAATLMDDPIAGDRAAEICAPLTDAWTIAARDGLHHPSLHRAARDCVELAVDRAPLLLRPQMTAYAELVESGRTPGDEVAARCEADGPLAALEALAREVDVDA
ncbi:MAG: ergothioneine biosynthesis glutamate--cysteine ligase EgtA, partial [Frankiaceae bacterium]|nr:ergothioneine biosynthesis glutamate--cysteine ligase EgtA [Frankiaceae bacterium]